MYFGTVPLCKECAYTIWWIKDDVQFWLSLSHHLKPLLKIKTLEHNIFRGLIHSASRMRKRMCTFIKWSNHQVSNVPSNARGGLFAFDANYDMKYLHLLIWTTNWRNFGHNLQSRRTDNNNIHCILIFHHSERACCFSGLTCPYRTLKVSGLWSPS